MRKNVFYINRKLLKTICLWENSFHKVKRRTALNLVRRKGCFQCHLMDYLQKRW